MIRADDIAPTLQAALEARSRDTTTRFPSGFAVRSVASFTFHPYARKRPPSQMIFAPVVFFI